MEEIANKSKEELQKMLAEKREAGRKFRFEMTGGKVKNVKEGKNIRKEIARVLTALNTNKE